MNECEEARHPEIGKQPLSASCGPPTAPLTSREAAARYTDPRQVVEDPALTPAEKREVLASWACDSRAPHDSPSSRMLDSGAVVYVREILEALKSLDGTAVPVQDDGPSRPRHAYPRRGRATWHAWRDRRLRKGRPEEDDDPPPCPVRSRPPGPTLPPLAAMATAPRYERMPDDALGRPMTFHTEPWRQRSATASAA